MTIFIKAIAPRLNPELTPAQIGLIAGGFVGSMIVLWTAAVEAVAGNHMYRKGVSTEIKQLQDAQAGLKKTIAVTAGIGAAYTGLKNATRILAPVVSPSSSRKQAGEVDHWLDAVGAVPAATVSKLHSYHVLHAKYAEAVLMAHPDFEKMLQESKNNMSVKSIRGSLIKDAGKVVSSLGMALRSPSSYLVTMYIAALVSALMHSKNALMKGHSSSEGFSANRLGAAEGAQGGAISTAMMSLLSAGATGIGIGASVFVDPYVDKLFDKLSAYMAGKTATKTAAKTAITQEDTPASNV